MRDDPYTKFRMRVEGVAVDAYRSCCNGLGDVTRGFGRNGRLKMPNAGRLFIIVA
jgi:hypothetical protein